MESHGYKKSVIPIWHHKPRNQFNQGSVSLYHISVACIILSSAPPYFLILYRETTTTSI